MSNESEPISLHDIENEVDLDEMFLGIWSAVEYGSDTDQYKDQILELCRKLAKSPVIRDNPPSSTNCNKNADS